jgi:hypothetical protein
MTGFKDNEVSTIPKNRKMQAMIILSNLLLDFSNFISWHFTWIIVRCIFKGLIKTIFLCQYDKCGLIKISQTDRIYNYLKIQDLLKIIKSKVIFFENSSIIQKKLVITLYIFLKQMMYRNCLTIACTVILDTDIDRQLETTVRFLCLTLCITIYGMRYNWWAAFGTPSPWWGVRTIYSVSRSLQSRPNNSDRADALTCALLIRGVI